MAYADDFYLQKQEPAKSCLLALRTIILNSHTDISETVKYAMPCFTYSGKPICYLWIDKVTYEPYVLFVDGKKLSHPKLETGTRKRMKILRIDSQKDIPARTLKAILKEALQLKASERLKTKME